MVVRESLPLVQPAAAKARGLLNGSNVEGNGIVALLATDGLSLLAIPLGLSTLQG